MIIKVQISKSISFILILLIAITSNSALHTQANETEAAGELFIKTHPVNAAIELNGQSVGNSPVLLKDVPQGIVRIEATMGNMYGHREAEIKAGELLVIEITLEYLLGRLFIKAAGENIKVILDNNELGSLGSGLFEDIPIGEHSVALQGDGLYAEQRVTINADATTAVEIELRRVGTLRYMLPKGATALISSEHFARQLAGSGVIYNLPVGDYEIEAAQPNYEPKSEIITIEQGKAIDYLPELQPTREFQAVLDKRQQEKKYIELISERRVLELELHNLQLRHRKLTGSGWILCGFGGAFAAA